MIVSSWGVCYKLTVLSDSNKSWRILKNRNGLFYDLAMSSD